MRSGHECAEDRARGIVVASLYALKQAHSVFSFGGRMDNESGMSLAQSHYRITGHWLSCAIELLSLRDG